jgi:selT/selW/selH-like putative selenoprotein
VFEVTLDGELVFSKKRLGRHAQPGEVLRLIRRER